MSISEWATTISGALAVLAVVGGTLRWIIKKYLSELRPNGGSSLRDSVNRLEDRVDKIYEILLQRGDK
jgi:hypothetical protein